MSSFEFSDRINQLPPYLFARLDKIKEAEIQRGRKIISLSIGDPDLPTPQFVIERLCLAAKNPRNHQYPSYWGMKEFRTTVSKWLSRRFGIQTHADTEVLALIGSKEGIAHIPLAFVNPGEAVLCPDPGYPVYRTSTLFAGGVPLTFPLHERNGFLPSFADLEALVKKGPRARILFLNYPNNPTSATATLEFFKQVVAFAKKHDLIVCHDNAYSELYFDGKPQPSFLQAPGAMDVGCEFHSLSKTFNMTGWRVGFAVGNAKVIDGLARVKTNVDSGVFNACQEAAIAALENDEPFCTELRAIYQERREVLVPALQEAGLRCLKPLATFYVWCRLPEGHTSEDFAMRLIQEHGIVATPGTGFGSFGEGYIRFTLCSDVSVLRQVAAALKKSIQS